ncbi:hypothetical protein A1O3_07067 [Capronia epimyces CBS 606.96]|uniref:Guanylate cyclase domain-containing protein n=1 Tax=Capronia epimyces CBS 606.96 TaxID=1182542 RepID=W9XKP6_9EURO|nr:uncharacterized protein A1O3_07067 [Capronia epimyces CBS 606.96]EXJ80783.1 hypothetical protein A1O3_07067 [Capronia epimyces CBS 606.96]
MGGHRGQDRDLGSAEQAIQPSTTKPTAPQGSLSIVFTDIVKSTLIWEKDSAAMTQAMQLHDSTIRHLTESNQGYEVKQNGDGFMIAFPTAASAVQFCLDVQERLLDENWPREILKLPPGQVTTDSDGNLLFRGLQLRMSAHWGTPVCKWNDVIERMDYLGPMVNRAARFIQATEAGQIVVSEDFLRQLRGELEMQAEEGGEWVKEKDEFMQQSGPTDAHSSKTRASDNSNNKDPAENNNDETIDLRALRSNKGQENLTNQRFEIQLLGDHEFRGLDEPQRLYFLVPRSLEGRVDHWHQVTHVQGVKGNVRRGSG